MATTDIYGRGTDQEIALFTKVRQNYDRSRRDLDIRRRDFDKKDELFRSYINPQNWPYKAQVADPTTFTFIIEKTSRLISNKLRGKVNPRSLDDWLKAKVVNELLDYQWDLATEGGSMLQKWALMDQNARKYGSAFGLCKWNFNWPPGAKEPLDDNPEFEVLPNRDCLYNPDHPNIRGWFQVRRYVTLEELQSVNDYARSKPVYKNLDILAQAIKMENSLSDRRDVNWVSRNKSIKGLQDTLGDSRFEKYLEIVTQYSPTKMVRFSPKHGVIIQEEDNPYGEIPIVHLRYYIIDDDIYGLSEIEPIEKLQKVENALISQYLDTVNSDLYPPLLIRSTGVQLHTLNFGPNQKWLMNDPQTDVRRFETSTAATNKFTETISFIISRMQNALGESSEGLSVLNPRGGKKTATEIQDSSIQRLARDNFNQIYLAEALKRQMLLWMKMNAKMITKNMIIRILASDSLEYLKANMLVKPQPGQADPVTGLPAQASPYGPDEQGQFGQGEPIHPVNSGKEVQPKFELDPTGDTGLLIIEPKDLDGIYDYIPDVEAMSIQNNAQTDDKMQLLQMVTTNPNISQMLIYEGVQLKLQDLITDIMEATGLKDAKRYFESSASNPLARHPFPKVDVRVIADANTPVGQALLQNQNVMQPQQLPQGVMPVQGGQPQPQAQLSPGQVLNDGGAGQIPPEIKQALEQQLGGQGGTQATEPIGAGTPASQGISASGGNGQLGGVGAGTTPALGSQTQPVVSRPKRVRK